jgi:hypothetical protein
MRVTSVLVALAVLMFAAVVPVGMTLAQGANPSRVLPAKVQMGTIFEVTVTFVSPANGFKLISLIDYAPDGWVVIVDEAWCDPHADSAGATGNRAAFTWGGTFNNGTTFSAVYKVTMPHDAELGIYNFTGALEYYIGSGGPYGEYIAGDSAAEVILPVIHLSPTSFSFSAVQGDSDPANQTLLIFNQGGETVNWTIYDDADWVNETPTSGSLPECEADYVEVSVGIAGLAAGMYSANISIEAGNATWNATWRIPVTLEIEGTMIINVTRCINETMELPNELYPGDTFEVLVNWTAPLNNFSAIGLTDRAPPGFEVDVNATWCDPDADEFNPIGSKVEILWFGPYDKGTDFTVGYNVTVPTTAAPGSHFFPYNNCSLGWLEYYFGEEWVYTSCIMGDYEVVVTVPGDIVGKTFDVNHNPLPDVDVALYLEGAGWLRSDVSTPNYTHVVNITEEYWLQASKTWYYDISIIDMTHLEDKYINLTTPELLAAGNTFNFSGDYGLIPRSCNMSYAQASVNLWMMHASLPEEVGLSPWKVNMVIASWQFPS